MTSSPPTRDGAMESGIEDLLRQAKVFANCTSEELADIRRLCQEVGFKSGDRIFKSDSPAEFLYIVAEGAVELRSQADSLPVSKEITLDRKFKGEAFGWSALTAPRVYTLSAVAMQGSHILRFKASDLHALCRENSHFGYLLMKNISEIIGERFTTVERMLIDVIQQSLTEKEP